MKSHTVMVNKEKEESIDNICRVCFKPGIIEKVELVTNGTHMQAVHEDGETHSWLKYDSLGSIGLRQERIPKYMKCPKCGDKGMIQGWKPDSQHPEIMGYLIKHEAIAGKWGKRKDPRYRRCYIVDKKMRDKVLKQLGRYIEK